MIAGTLEIQLLADMARLQKDMEASKRIVAGAMQTIERSVISAKATLGGLLAGLAAGISVAAFTQIVKGCVESAAALNDLSIQTGATVGALSGLASVGKYSDISAQQIAASMNILTKNMAGATEESKGAGKALEALGIDFEQFKRLSPDQQMLAVAKSMGQFEDGAGKAAVAMALYGKEGAKMLPFLKDLADLGDIQAKVTAEQAAMADNFSDNLTRLQGSGDAWKKELAMGMIPALNDAVQAFIDVTNGTGGLRDEVRKLSKDGSIAEWTRSAITGVTYVMDVFSGLKRVIFSVGTSIGAIAALIANSFGSAAETISRVLHGDFSGALKASEAGAVRQKAIWADLGSTLSAAWSEETLGQKLRARMADLSKVGQVAEQTKGKLNFTNITDQDKGGKAGINKEQISEYDKLIKSIQEKIAVQNLALVSAENLTEGEKLLAKVHADMDKGVLKVTASQREYVDALLEKLIAEEKGVEIKKAMAKAASDLIAVGAKELKSVEDQLEKQREHNEQIGLSKDEVERLTAAKIDLEAAADRELAANMRAAADYAGPLHDAYLQYAADLERAAAAKNELANAKRDGAARQAEADAVEAAAKEWQKAFDDISQSLTDAIMRGFEGGKSIAKNFRDTLTNMFKTMVLRPVIQAMVQPFVAPLTSMFSSFAGASGGMGTLGAGGNGLDIMNAFNGIWQNGGIAGTFGRGIEQLGGWMGNGTVQNFGLGMQGYSSLSSYGTQGLGVGQMAGQFMNGLGGFMAGRGIGQAISNGYAVSGSGNGLVNAGAAIGAIWGPIGSAIGGAIGGAVNRAFGRKLKDTGIEGSISGSDFTGNSFKFYKGGWFRSDKTERSALDEQTSGVFSDAIATMHESFVNLGKIVGTSSSILDDFSHSFKLSLNGLSDEAAQKEIQRALSGTSDAMANAFVDKFRNSVMRQVERTEYLSTRSGNDDDTQTLIPYTVKETVSVTQEALSTQLDPYIEDMLRIFDAKKASLVGVRDVEGELAAFTQSLFALGDSLVENKGYVNRFFETIDFDKLEAAAKRGETVMDTFGRLSSIFDATNSVAQTLGKDMRTAFGAVGLASTEARERLINLAGGMESLAQGTSFFAQNFLSEAERLAPVQAAVTAEMTRLGYAGVTTHEQFKNLVMGFDLSNASQVEAYAALMRIAPAFDTVAEAAIQGASALNDAQKAERERAEQVRMDALDAAESRRQLMVSLVDVTFDALTRSVEAERKRMTDAHAQAMQAIEENIQAMGDSIGALSRRSDTLRNALDRMRAPGQVGAYREEGQAFISTALAVVRAGGKFTDDSGLQRALDSVSQPSEDLFSSYVDYQRDFYQTAIAITDLSEATDVQLSVEEKTLEALNEQKRVTEEAYQAEMARLDGILSAAQEEVNAIHGVDSTLMSVSQALISLNGAIASARTAGAGSTGAAYSTSGAALAAINQAYQSNLYRAPENGGLQYWTQQVANGSSISSVVDAIANSNEAKVQQLYGSVLGRVGEAEGVNYWRQQLDAGVSLDTVRQQFLSSAEYVSKTQQYQDDLANGVYRRLPGFANGGIHSGGWRVVGERGPELEYTGPSSVVSNTVSSRMLDMSSMEQEIKGLRSDMRQMQASVVRNTGKMADIVTRWEKTGMPEQREVENA